MLLFNLKELWTSILLADRVHNAIFTQDARPSLHVSLITIQYNTIQYNTMQYSTIQRQDCGAFSLLAYAVMAPHFPVPQNDLPTEIPVNVMHNKTQYIHPN